MSSEIRTYSELIERDTFEDRYKYLRIQGQVGCETFGNNRWINQQFYTSREWRLLRRDAIARDGACDLGIPGREIHSGLIVHHMNPITQKDLEYGTPMALDLENLICTTLRTHNAIHFGDEDLLLKEFVPRAPGDTKLW
jgi:hypothetical protein